MLPVLPSADIERDVKWYQEHTGFELLFADKMYAVLHRDGQGLHLQWHADTADDPLLGGSVVRIGVKDILPLVDEFVSRGTIKREKFIEKTAWNTREFGFYDLNRNAIFIAEDLGE